VETFDINTCIKPLKELLNDESSFFNIADEKDAHIDICKLNCDNPVDFERRAGKLLVEKSKEIIRLVEMEAPLEKLIDANKELEELVNSLRLKVGEDKTSGN
jgi:hypothetical protein